MPGSWWERAVIYQVYPRSYADSSADGIGDLPGITSKLDYLLWLGVEALWMRPTFPSPNADWGYDVSDYRGRRQRRSETFVRAKSAHS
jgi:alpha-glucosidase